jgi:nitroimidazol reductase NimA-like FMN-containing flavoprotein (pyridoxamine 5'-phosphate oxidase superfamily)
MARKDITMTEGELLEFLSEGQKTLQVASSDPDGYSHLVPMWFVVEDGKVVFRSFSKSQKILNLRRNPKLTVLAEEGKGYSELRGAMIKGDATLIDDAAYCLDLYVTLAGRYPFFAGAEPGTTPEDEVREFFSGHAAKNTAVVVEPIEVVSWDHRKLSGGY